MNKKRKLRIFTAFFSILLVLCISGLLVLDQSRRNLQAKLNSERLKSELLLSEKLLIQKTVDKKEKSNSQLAQNLSELNSIVSEQDEKIANQYAKYRQEKRKLQHEKERMLSALSLTNQNYTTLRAKAGDSEKLYEANQHLRDSLNALNSEIAFLQREINEMALRAIDQIQISALRKHKSKVTTKARAVKKIIVISDVPGVLHDLTYIIEGPDGSVLSNKDGSITAIVIDSDQTLTASNSESAMTELQPQKLEITFTPDRTLLPGDYTLKIFNSSRYVGSMSIRLR